MFTTGGTIDITVHEVLPDGNVREIHTATGGPWGGKKVDDYFILLLRQILGDKFIDLYMKDQPQQWLGLLTSFEKIKKSAKPDGKSKINLPLSWSMGQKYQEFMGSGIEGAIKKASGLGITFANGAFIMNQAAILDLFEPVVTEIVANIETLFREPKVAACKYFLLVGGFGESPFLQDAVENKFGGRVCLLVPSEAQMSVIKGAILFGHKPTAIKSRVSKKTYGIKIRREYIPGVHVERHLIQRSDGKIECRNIFDRYVLKGEGIDTGFTKTVTYFAVESDQTGMGIVLYAIDRYVAEDEILYCDDPSVEEIGRFTIDMPDTRGGLNREVQLDIEFGGTEIQIRGTDVTTGNVAETKIDFLTE